MADGRTDEEKLLLDRIGVEDGLHLDPEAMIREVADVAVNRERVLMAAQCGREVAAFLGSVLTGGATENQAVCLTSHFIEQLVVCGCYGEEEQP